MKPNTQFILSSSKIINEEVFSNIMSENQFKTRAFLIKNKKGSVLEGKNIREGADTQD